MSVRTFEARRKREEAAQQAAFAERQIAEANAMPNDTEVRALREQRRLIDLEERRLRALLQIEKEKLVRKEEQLQAKLALKHRREDKLRTRRALFAELQSKRKEQEHVVQKIAMGLEPPPPELIRSLRQLYAPAGSYYQRDVAIATANARNAEEDIAGAAAYASASIYAAVETASATVALTTAPVAAANAPFPVVAEVANAAAARRGSR